MSVVVLVEFNSHQNFPTCKRKLKRKRRCHIIVPLLSNKSLQRHVIKSFGSSSLILHIISKMKSSVVGFLAATSLLGDAPALARYVDCYDIAASIARMAPDNAPFTANVVLPTDMGYNNSVFQFAYPTFSFRMSPNIIVEAQSETDVQAAVMFASECGYNVAARSGGHAYLGGSSCDSNVHPCLQIDLGSFKERSLNGRLLTLGPGVFLFEMAEFSFVNNIFLPAGECSHVAVGGHTQTGGFGIW